MGEGERFQPDWTDEAAYAPLLGADRSLFAWEWLRRDPDYRSASQSVAPIRDPEGPARFGLVAFEPAAKSVPDARPMWRRGAFADLLRVELGHGGAALGDMVDACRAGADARLVVDDMAEHLLLSDGLRCIRLDGAPGCFTAGPAFLRYSIEGIAAAERPLVVLRRFLALCRAGRFSTTLHRPEPRARRWILMLRAWDALAGGAGQREIAERLLSRSAAEARWRTREPSLRSQVQRLARAARAMASGGYRELLR